MEEKTTYTLVNPPFTFNFADKEYQVKKANLEQVIQYQKRLREITDTKQPEAQIIPYCIFLILNKADDSITEQYVSENTPGDIDPFECLLQLGFMNPRQAQLAREMTGLVAKTTESSS